MIKLTPKQDAFARAYIELGNASAAYRQCYDVSPDCNPGTVWTNAHLLLANDKVGHRILELQERAAERTMVTIESLTNELDVSRRLAADLDRPAAMNSATMGKAKLHGLGSEKTKVEADISDRMKEILDRASQNTKRLGE